MKELENLFNYRQGGATDNAVKGISNAMKLEDALKFMKENFKIRTIDEIICEAVGKLLHNKMIEVPHEEARLILKQKLEPGLTKREVNTIEENIRLWLEPQNNRSIDKKSAIHIAFALQMTLEDTSFFWLFREYSGKPEKMINFGNGNIRFNKSILQRHHRSPFTLNSYSCKQG